MIPTSAVVCFATAGIYLFVALHFGGLWAMRRNTREHGLFSVLCVVLAGFALGVAWQRTTETVAEAVPAQMLIFASVSLAMAAYAAFCEQVGGRSLAVPTPSPVERVAWVMGGIGAAITLSGLSLDPSVPSAHWDGRLTSHGGHAIPQLLPLGWAALVGGLAATSIAVARLGRRAIADRDLRSTFIAACLPLLVGIADAVERAYGPGTSIASALAPLTAVVGITWALLGRMGRVETELAARTEELASSYDRVREAQQELVRKEQLAAVGELSAVIAHEVRNPLAVIRNAVSGLRRPELKPADVETLLVILDEEADRLNRLVQDLLAYARPAEPTPESIELPRMLERAVELAREGQSHRKNIEFDLQFDETVSSIECDAALLRHALINIADNAIQAMPEGGTIAVRVRAAELDGRPAVAIDFHDEGEGMDTLVRSKARDPFFTTRQTGTGLGLAIVDRVARVHGGRVEIESRHGQGTTVTLVLPRQRVSLALPGSFS
ncbi:two-component system sensor histidine kinase NtrB [Sandaracinus amylolyticus]|uniref:two-component system sensor histidine kinase NtrB n=1 Tax=Sandaracinus amylolyticus TaxID=927083 RepID=UPI001F41E8B1|nr:ATP-binding protein [Sandaracinus amylolyticus]UJR80997.1 Flagellar sensor histidine kinase FleS [Sandaracinus amylolyticus]